MSRLLVSVLPSNQDRNPVVGGGNEMNHMLDFGLAVLEAAARYPQSIVAWMFSAEPESWDYPPGSLGNLIAQQKQAAAWLAETRQPGDLTVALNLHSDSGRESHCGYYGPFGTLPISQWLGRALTDSIKRWFGGKVYSADYSSYVFARETRHVGCPVLLEVGAHTIAADVAAVREHGPEIARALVDTMVGFFGLGSEPPLDFSELRTFGEWHLARCGVGEDPRDMAAFRAHLKALGCADDPRRYGAPV